MQPLFIYAFGLVGLAATLFLLRQRSRLRALKETIVWCTKRYLLNATIISRHRFLGPWRLGPLILCLAFIAVNVLFVWYPEGTVAKAGRRSGFLALINMAALYASPSLSILAHILGLSVQGCRRFHRAISWMTCALVGFHMAPSLASGNIYGTGTEAGIIASALFLLTVMLSLPIARRYIYPIYYIIHYILAALVICGIWMHLPLGAQNSFYIVYATIGTFGLGSMFWACMFCYHNGAFTPSWTKAKLVSREDGTIRAEIYPGRPIKVLPGQYVDIWTPSINPWSWFQGSSFIVTSWSAEKQRTLQLYTRSCSRRFGFTWLLLQRALSQKQHNHFFFSGPHGRSTPAQRYETVILIASDSGILAIKPYVEQLFYCVKARTSKTRRLRLVWQISGQNSGLWLLADMCRWTNRLLEDDIEDDAKMLQITIYDPKGLWAIDLGENGGRGVVSREPANFRSILKHEVRNHRERLANDVDRESGGMLVLVSAFDEDREALRESVKPDSKYVHTVELDYQPSKVGICSIGLGTENKPPAEDGEIWQDVDIEVEKLGRSWSGSTQQSKVGTNSFGLGTENKAPAKDEE